MKFFRSMLTFLVVGLFLVATPTTSLAAEAWTTDPATGCKIGVVFLTDNRTLVSASLTGACGGKARLPEKEY
ncbi:MAG: hypothetical protein H6Q72_4892 [Firmicutes bacterium]|nr:hypothetical protein [Bacillota bacterium]